MKPAFSMVPAALLAVLSGCSGKGQPADNAAVFDAADEGGRYSGIGTYPSDGLWNDIQGAAATNDTEAARQGDDSQIIVVVDRRTGEVRQCGNRSGFCIAMNPWKGARRDATPQAPVRIDRHPTGNQTANAAEAELAKPANQATKH